jgi:hypothetical protein
MSSSIDPSTAVRRAFVLHGLACATGVVALVLTANEPSRHSAVRGEGAVFLAGLALGWLVGVPLSLSRLRPWVVVVGALVCVWALVLAMRGGVILEGPGRAFEAIGRLLFSSLFGAASSYALLAPRLDTGALWLPLGLYVSAAVAWLNNRGAVDTWRSNKLAAWDVPSAALIATGVVFFVAMLRARQRVSRARWSSAGARVDAVDATVADKGRVVVAGVALAAIVLLVSPFLLRTRAGCEDCTATAEASMTTSPPPAATAPPPRAEPSGTEQLWATWRRLVAAAADVARTAALVGAFGLFAGAAALPALRRRRLRDLATPAPSLPPTERVRRRFRRALVALDELGVAVDGALAAPRGLLAAVGDVDEQGGPPALADAVAVWEQVRFGGRGLPDDAEERMARAMTDVVAWARRRRSAWQALSSAFRLPSLAA